MRGRYDGRRAAIALLAALIAGIGAYSAIARGAMPGSDLAAALLIVEALIALTLALWPGRWVRRRAISAAAAIFGLVLMFPFPVLSAIVTGCGCSAEASNLPPLGVPHQIWVLAGLIGTPILLGLAAFIPTRPVPAEMPIAPEA
ncbi:MAG TPA: hypothetical protein VEX62_08885 [Candidatus Limnocylindrales bacterium]|nr:hypothetical protein [Candidatus Limnocylindrales bacterium]